MVLTPDHNKSSIPIRKLPSWASAPSVPNSRLNYTSSRDQNSRPVVDGSSGGWSNVAATLGQINSGWGNQLTAAANTGGWNTLTGWDTSVSNSWENCNSSLSTANNGGGWGDNSWGTPAKVEPKSIELTTGSCLEQLRQESTVTLDAAFLRMGNPHRSVKSSQLEERFLLLHKWASEEERKKDLTAALRNIALKRKSFDPLTCAYLHETLESQSSDPKPLPDLTCPWGECPSSLDECACKPTSSWANLHVINPSFNSAAATAASSPKSSASLSPTKTVHWDSLPTNAPTGWNSPTPTMTPGPISPILNHTHTHTHKDEDERDWDKTYEQLFLSGAFTPKQLWKSNISSGLTAREKVRDLADVLMEMIVEDSCEGGEKRRVVVHCGRS